ncbi:2811_t:CDS:2 [Acaulospora morrowiae]|uniref:2811_t:CDS:1 n=1 Tax=Acaulospora morrowiae TaxID=94023 RepID=A0A9N9AET7_9GLOM|nr:2811_t:CDS:2 [Acaulospora morrowiae]
MKVLVEQIINLELRLASTISLFPSFVLTICSYSCRLTSCACSQNAIPSFPNSYIMYGCAIIHKIGKVADRGIVEITSPRPSLMTISNDQLLPKLVRVGSGIKKSRKRMDARISSKGLPSEYKLFVKPSQGSGHEYEASHCTGKKKALLIGINYVGTEFELKGCFNDVYRIKKFLTEHYGFNESNIVTLMDDGRKDPDTIPTRENITRHIKKLMENPQKHDSGHGGQLVDEDGDEEDGFDETILPLDWKVNGHIIDDELHKLLVDPLPSGVRLTVVFDSCHSGTVLDLPYIYSTRGTIKRPTVIAKGLHAALNAGAKYLQGDTQGIKDSMKSLVTGAFSGQKIRRKALETKSSPADVVMFSGCKDEQTSADANEGGASSGAMSYALVHSLEKNDHPTYRDLLNAIRDILHSKYVQRPQLSA